MIWDINILLKVASLSLTLSPGLYFPPPPLKKIPSPGVERKTHFPRLLLGCIINVSGIGGVVWLIYIPDKITAQVEAL